VHEAGRRVLLLPGDLTDPAFCKETVERTVAELGQLDVLVNNAAYQQHVDSLEELTDEQMEHTFRVNVFGYIRMCRAALPHMKEGAAIVNTGSFTGLEGSKDLLDDSATKGAIHAFTKSLAQSLVDRGIGRPAQPEEIAPSFVFFASSADSRYITGEVLTLLGGETTAA